MGAESHELRVLPLNPLVVRLPLAFVSTLANAHLGTFPLSPSLASTPPLPIYLLPSSPVCEWVDCKPLLRSTSSGSFAA